MIETIGYRNYRLFSTQNEVIYIFSNYGYTFVAVKNMHLSKFRHIKKEKIPSMQKVTFIYRSTSLCQTCLSRIHGLCRSDHPFPNFSPILHCNSTLLMSNSVIMKTRLYRSDFSFHKANFPFVYHCLYRSGQKVKRSNDKQSNLPD